MSIEELFDSLSEGAVDLGLAYGEQELLNVDDKGGAATEDSGAAATPAGENSGVTLSGLGRTLPDWVVPAGVVVGGVLVVVLLLKAVSK